MHYDNAVIAINNKLLSTTAEQAFIDDGWGGLIDNNNW